MSIDHAMELCRSRLLCTHYSDAVGRLQADIWQGLGEYKEATMAYKRAIAEAPAADLGLLEVSMGIPTWPCIRGL